jgi:hypothetical protein
MPLKSNFHFHSHNLYISSNCRIESKFTFHLQDNEAVAFFFKREDKDPGSDIVERKGSKMVSAEEDKIAGVIEQDKIAGVIERVPTAAKVDGLLAVFDGATTANLDKEDKAKKAPAVGKIAGVSGKVTEPVVDGVTKSVLDSGSEVNAKRKAPKRCRRETKKERFGGRMNGSQAGSQVRTLRHSITFFSLRRTTMMCLSVRRKR